RHHQHPGQPREGLRRRRLPDDQADLREPRSPVQRPLRGQGHQAGNRDRRSADPAASGRRALLQGSRRPQVTAGPGGPDSRPACLKTASSDGPNPGPSRRTPMLRTGATLQPFRESHPMSETQGLHSSPSEWPKTLFYVALLFSTYQIITAAFHPVSSQVLPSGHVGFLLLMVFLCYPAKGNGRPWQPLAWLLGLAGMATAFYQWYFEGDLVQRSGDLTGADMIVGIVLAVLVFEAGRRVMGIALPTICAIFLVYGL